MMIRPFRRITASKRLLFTWTDSILCHWLLGWCMHCLIGGSFDRQTLMCSFIDVQSFLVNGPVGTWLPFELHCLWTHQSSHLWRKSINCVCLLHLHCSAHLRRFINLCYISELVDWITWHTIIYCSKANMDSMNSPWLIHFPWSFNEFIILWLVQISRSNWSPCVKRLTVSRDWLNWNVPAITQ